MEEYEPNLDMNRLFAYMCEKSIVVTFKNTNKFSIWCAEPHLQKDCEFSDLYYPKELLKVLKAQLGD